MGGGGVACWKRVIHSFIQSFIHSCVVCCFVNVWCTDAWSSGQVTWYVNMSATIQLCQHERHNTTQYNKTTIQHGLRRASCVFRCSMHRSWVDNKQGSKKEAARTKKGDELSVRALSLSLISYVTSQYIYIYIYIYVRPRAMINASACYWAPSSH